jgi:hypothetical protein
MTISPANLPDIAPETLKTSPGNPVTGLDRAVDPRYPSNRFALLAAGLGGVIAWSRGATPLQTVSSAAWTFSSWSLARELDPDDADTAGVSAIGTLVALATQPDAVDLAGVALSANGALLMAARTALNTTGRDLEPGDYATVAGAPLVGQALTGAPLVGLGVASAGALTARRSPWWSVALALAPLAFAHVKLLRREEGDDLLELPPTNASLPGAALLALGALNALRPAPQSRADNGAPLTQDHWRWAQGSVWLGAALSASRLPGLAFGALVLTGAAALLRQSSDRP